MTWTKHLLCFNLVSERDIYIYSLGMADDPGLMSILVLFFSDDHDDPLPFYSTIYMYIIAVVNMVLSKYVS